MAAPYLQDLKNWYTRRINFFIDQPTGRCMARDAMTMFDDLPIEMLYSSLSLRVTQKSSVLYGRKHRPMTPLLVTSISLRT